MPRVTPPNRKSILTFTHWLLLLVAVNAIARLPLCWDPATVDNDGAEYLAIARHLRTTGQYVTDLKWQFFTGDPVRHLAWADRPPLFPYLALVYQRALPFLAPTAAARLGNAALACAALVLCAVYLRRLFGDRCALFATGFAFLLPHMLKWTTQPMTETVALALTFGALLVWDVTVLSETQAQRRNAGALCCGILSGLAYLARPTGALLVLILLAHHTVRALRSTSPLNDQPPAPNARLPIAVALVAGFALCALPYHLLLWQLYGNPLHSALGFTFAVRTYYEVSYYGFEATRPTVRSFLRDHWAAVPGLVLQQMWRHVQILVPQLLPFLPLAPLLRRGDWSERRWPGIALVAGTLIVHTLTWSAWGSSRYFLPCLPLAIALLLSAAELRCTEGAAPPWMSRYVRSVPGVAGAGLAVCLLVFYATFARADRGLPELPAWKRAALEVRGAALVASDKPSILNLLLEIPAVRLPRTTDPQQLARFIQAYRPDALVLFVDERAERPMAEAWRGGRLPEGWRLDVDRGSLLIARPVAGHGVAPPARPRVRWQMRQAEAPPVVN
jgi:4-amino-4-deoxy-L-arabinose transferase-like glycosyltransferase